MAIKELLDQIAAEKAKHDDLRNGLMQDIVNQLAALHEQLAHVEAATDALRKLPPA